MCFFLPVLLSSVALVRLAVFALVWIFMQVSKLLESTKKIQPEEFQPEPAAATARLPGDGPGQDGAPDEETHRK